MKKLFPCGHKGQGKFCHRCKAADALEREAPSPKPEVNDERKKRVEQLRSLPKAPITSVAGVPVA